MRLSASRVSLVWHSLSLVQTHRSRIFIPFCRPISQSTEADIASLTSADNDVLVEIGTTPTGLSNQGKESYVEGLRQVIQEIRGRKVKDFNKVAAEISAYRARFLGDASKILPLET